MRLVFQKLVGLRPGSPLCKVQVFRITATVLCCEWQDKRPCTELRCGDAMLPLEVWQIMVLLTTVPVPPERECLQFRRSALCSAAGQMLPAIQQP